jgi:hypothetical protein
MAGTSPAMTLKGRTARPKRELLAANQGGGMIHTVVLKSPAGTALAGFSPAQRFWSLGHEQEQS